MTVIMDRLGGIAKRLESDTNRKTRDLVKGCKGSETVFEGSGGLSTVAIDVKAESEEWQTQSEKPAIAGTRGMEVDAVAGVPSYNDARWEQECEETECTRCGQVFHRH